MQKVTDWKVAYLWYILFVQKVVTIKNGSLLFGHTVYIKDTLLFSQPLFALCPYILNSTSLDNIVFLLYKISESNNLSLGLCRNFETKKNGLSKMFAPPRWFRSPAPKKNPGLAPPNFIFEYAPNPPPPSPLICFQNIPNIRQI